MHTVELGKIIEGFPQRDAIHIAVAPVVAAEELQPGQDIGLLEHNHGKVGWKKLSSELIGIVDPFLKKNVQLNQSFWMFLYPNTITSLRHDWAHPAFAPSDSESWLKDFADELHISYDQLLQAAQNWINNSERFCLGFEIPDRVYDDCARFWTHYQIVTNQFVNEEEIMFFRCAC